MTFEEYQNKAKETAVYPTTLLDIPVKNAPEAVMLPDMKWIYPVLGLTGEAGEVADKFKKIVRDKTGFVSDEDKVEIVKELGDVLWYISAIAGDLGVDLESVAKGNIAKLSKRKAEDKIKGSGDNR